MREGTASTEGMCTCTTQVHTADSLLQSQHIPLLGRITRPGATQYTCNSTSAL